MTRLTRRCAVHRATTGAGIPGYASDMAPVRGRCLRKRCGARWGVVRVTIDTRDATRIDRFAHVECAACGRVWRRVKIPAITSAAGYQRVRLTLVLPAEAHRWYARGRWHREGDDAVTIIEATIGDLDEAARAHRAKSETRLAAAARKRDRDQQAASDQQGRTRELLQRLAAYDAENREDAA